MLRLIRTLCGFAVNKTRTLVFSKLTPQQYRNPSLCHSLIRRRIPFHSQMSLVGLYHKKRVRHAIQSCFSEKKSKIYKRVHKVKREMYSDILGKKIRVVMSYKAYRCIQKHGSFDNYILCTKPKDLDSKFGEYLRELMLRKINDPEYRLPYILKTKRALRLRKYKQYLLSKEFGKMVIPKQFKKSLQTFQRQFGTSVDEFNNEDYQKYLELEKLKKVFGNQMDPKHPLLLEISKKLQRKSLQDEEKVNEMAEKFKNQYLNHPKHGDLRKISYEANEKESALLHVKLREEWKKFRESGEIDQ